MALQGVQHHPRLAPLPHCLRQEPRLVVSAPPKSPAVQWYRHDDPPRIEKCQLGKHQPRQHRRKRNAVAMLECQDEFARGIVVQRGGNDTVVTRRLREARRTDRVVAHAIGEGTVAQRTGRFRRNFQLIPARRAQPRLCGDGIAADRAARRKDQVDCRSQSLGKTHLAQCDRSDHARQAVAWSGATRQD